MLRKEFFSELVIKVDSLSQNALKRLRDESLVIVRDDHDADFHSSIRLGRRLWRFLQVVYVESSKCNVGCSSQAGQRKMFSVKL